MHHVPRRYSWLSLAFLTLASGCPASPPNVSPRADGGPDGPPDARVADAAGPEMDAPGPQGDGGGPLPDARPGSDGGGPMGDIVEYGWPPDNEFTSIATYPQDLVIMQRLTIVNAGYVAYLGMIARGLGGTAAKIGLYRETGGEPITLMASTDVFTTQPGINEHPPLDDVFLAAGNYWTAVILDGQTDLATSSATMSTLRTADVPFLSAFPMSLASSIQVDAPDINVYVGIREDP
jgi:hypothetical protein